MKYITIRKKKSLVPTPVVEQEVSWDDLSLNSFLAKHEEEIFEAKEVREFRTIELDSHRDEVMFKDINARTAIAEMYQKFDPVENHISHYSVFQIPKSSGGYRTIKAPNEVLSAKQKELRFLLEGQYNFNMMPHNAAFAYVPTRSVKDALIVHQNNKSNWFLKLDFKDFFGSCTTDLVQRQLKKHYPVCNMDIETSRHFFEMLNNLAYLDGALPQGTPLSPTLTNLVMIEFDYLMTKYAYANKLRYTRYADDILLTSKYEFEYRKVVEEVKGLLETNGYEELKLNNEKTRYASASGSNWNLGLMYNKHHDITIGHKNKRKLKLQMFLFVKNISEWSVNEVQILNGNLEWLRSNEPDAHAGLIQWFNRKHGVNIMALVLHALK